MNYPNVTTEFDWETVGGKNFLTTHLMTQAFLKVKAEQEKPRSRTRPGQSGDNRTEFLSIYADEIREHRRKLRKRGFALAVEHCPPTDQAALWYGDVIHFVPRSGRDVARQIARLAGDDSQVTIPWRSLADAVGIRNRAGNLVSYTERGVQALVEAGWLTVETVGEKRGAKTTFTLQVGEFSDRAWLEGEGEYCEEWG
ncbi:hypothetical protein [Streptomyces sp. NBC_01428]|uniref:hypothetical protein n=1 Tax=Streptomyces sp. NBC_01428 TaxID=2903861 RepID=UPI002E30E20E|nr:hypothetical protein [Streptomyces sp. NBC_01428]